MDVWLHNKFNSLRIEIFLENIYMYILNSHFMKEIPSQQGLVVMVYHHFAIEMQMPEQKQMQKQQLQSHHQTTTLWFHGILKALYQY